MGEYVYTPEQHPAFVQPSDPNIKLWRYMNLAKFVHLLDTKSLFFAAPESFNDPFEGSVTKPELARRAELEADKPGATSWIKEGALIDRGSVAISCWHMNEHESDAMWSRYVVGGEGIAIQSTFAKFVGSLPQGTKYEIPTICPIFVGKVNYIDFDSETFTPGNHYYRFVHKRKAFEHERELRAVIWQYAIERIERPPPGPDATLDELMLPPFRRVPGVKGGIPVGVDVRGMIEKVFIAPSCRTWFAEVVRSIIGKYGFNFHVQHSRLDDGPAF